MSTSPYLDTKAHEEYIYHRLQEISKKISPTPPLNFQPTNGSPRQILNSSKASLAPHQGSLHTEEVKELSNLVMALQDNLRRIQQDYLQVLVKSDHETQHRISLEQILSQISTELNETQLALEEKQQVIDKIQNDFQQLQVQYNQRERQLQNLNEENETYLQKLQSVQAELRKSDERNRENDKSRNDSLVEMKQQILQFKIDLEFATSHISLLSAQKNQAESELTNAQARVDSLRDEISSLNISFNSIVQNLQNATLLLNTKSQSEAQLTARIEELEEQLKIKVIALQRNALNSKEFEASLQDLTTRLAENENELLEARQTIQQLTCQIKTLEEEGQQKARELAQLMIHKEKYQTVENRISELEILNRDLNTLQADAEKIICDLNVTVAERARDYRILEDKYDRSVQKIKELESESSTLVDEMVSKLKAENSSLHERYQETLKSFEDFRETVAANGTTALSTSPIVDMNFLNEKVTALEKQNLEMASRLQSEISEKETLSTRVHYLEDMLESISQTAINSSDKKLSALELENKQLKVDIEKLQEELKEVRLKMQHSTPDSSALSTVVHPVYDIFGLSENFEGFPKGELAKESRDLSPSSSHELESKSSESNFLKGNKSSSHLSPSAKVIDSSPSQHEGDHMEDHLSSSALVSSKSTKIKPSVSALPDAKAFRAYRKKLQGEISALRKDRQILKKEILEWNAKFERENGREAMKEEKEKLASDLYDRYQDITSVLRKNEAKLERAEEKYKSLLEETESNALSRQGSQEPEPIDD